MKRPLLALLVGTAALSAVAPAMAQPYGAPPPPAGDRMGPPPPPSGGYDRDRMDGDRDHDRDRDRGGYGDRDHDRDRDRMGGGYGVGRDFWRGAPQTPWERVQWLQERINHGRQDGSLNPGEARRAQFQLDKVRVYAQGARRRYGDLRPQDRDYIQRQLDYVSRLIHWERHDGR